MADLVARHGQPRLGPRPAVDERFEHLARMIAYQQLAGAAASAIWGRVQDRVGDVTPESFLATEPSDLRAAGLSGAKTASLLDLAAKTDDGAIDLRRTGRMDDRAVIEHLCQARGVGPWTAQMYLMFVLRRLDVWPTGDLGVRKGYAIAHSLTVDLGPKDLEPLGDPFRPYRSVAAWYCWQACDVVLPG